MTEQYLKEFERWVAGPKERKQQVRGELEEHLRAAESAGDLDAMGRLGTPREAAEAFSSGYEMTPASLPRRVAAAVVDFGVFVALIFLSAGLGAWDAELNPGVQIDGNNTGWDAVGAGAVIALLSAAVWWVIALPLLEWRTGRTLGKSLFGLRTVSESGTAAGFGQIVLRRLTLIFSGPLQLIDWGFVFFNKKRQRGLDVLARTLVVSEQADRPLPKASVVNAIP